MKKLLFLAAIVIMASCNSNEDSVATKEAPQEALASRTANQRSLVLIPTIKSCERKKTKDTYITKEEADLLLAGKLRQFNTYKVKDGYSYTLNALKAINVDIPDYDPDPEEGDDVLPCIDDAIREYYQNLANETCIVQVYKCCNQVPGSQGGAASSYSFYPNPTICPQVALDDDEDEL